METLLYTTCTGKNTSVHKVYKKLRTCFCYPFCMQPGHVLAVCVHIYAEYLYCWSSLFITMIDTCVRVTCAYLDVPCKVQERDHGSKNMCFWKHYSGNQYILVLYGPRITCQCNTHTRGNRTLIDWNELLKFVEKQEKSYWSRLSAPVTGHQASLLKSIAICISKFYVIALEAPVPNDHVTKGHRLEQSTSHNTRASRGEA